MSLQVAPFDAGYNLLNSSTDWATFYSDRAKLNTYTGAAYQQAASGLVNTSRHAYELTQNQYDTYGYFYKPGTDSDSRITWTVGGDRVWTLRSSAIGADSQTEIGPRLIPEEPMYIILNLGLSSSFT
jgi:beta-glucan synthesis-associated protein KRE6